MRQVESRNDTAGSTATLRASTTTICAWVERATTGTRGRSNFANRRKETPSDLKLALEGLAFSVEEYLEQFLFRAPFTTLPPVGNNPDQMCPRLCWGHLMGIIEKRPLRWGGSFALAPRSAIVRIFQFFLRFRTFARTTNFLCVVRAFKPGIRNIPPMILPYIAPASQSRHELAHPWFGLPNNALEHNSVEALSST